MQTSLYRKPVFVNVFNCARNRPSIFFTTQQRLLSLLFGQPGRTYLATELIRLAGVGGGTVQRKLKWMTDSGLMNATRIGNQKHFTLKNL